RGLSRHFPDLNEAVAFKQYLNRLLGEYGSIMLQLDAVTEAAALEEVFVPLKLRRVKSRFVSLGAFRGRFATLTHDLPWIAKQDEVAENAQNALKQSTYGRLLILGDSGSGKTTQLQYFLIRQTHALLEKAPPSAGLVAPLPDQVPIFVS